MNKVLLASLLVVFAVGCKKGPVIVVKDPGPAQVTQGTQIAESSDKSVSIMVAPGWKRGSPNSSSMPSLGGLEGMGEGMGSAPPSNEETAINAEEAADLEKKGILIWINGSSRPIPGEQRTYYRVKVKKDGPMSLEDAATAAKDDMMNESAPQFIDLPIGKVARLEGLTKKIDGGELYEVIYVVVNGEDVYSVKFGTQEQPTIIQGIEKDVMNSLRIKPAAAG